MEFLDFQIWTGPWIWKFGWKCGMVKDLALCLSFVCPSGMEFGVKQQKKKFSVKRLLKSLPYRAIGAFLASILALLFGLHKIYADVLSPVFSHG